MKIISAIGDDATTFLQGQLTCDVQQVGESFSPAAWCTPKGRVIVVFRIRRVANGYDLLCPEDLADAVMRRFIMYRLRSKVELQTRDATVDDLDGLSAADWLAGQVSAGIPHIDASNTEAYTPHMLNLDLAGAVSFDKGCYTGQEIVARTHFRGSSRRRLQRYSFDGEVSQGAKISLGDREIGDVVNAAGGELLAVLPLENAEDELTVGGQPLAHRELPYTMA